MTLDDYTKYGFQYKDGYGHYEIVRVTEGDRKGLKTLQGLNAKWEIDVVPILPLNGWRGRNLAEKVFGKRDDSVWMLGTSKLVRVEDLLDLPGWDDAFERHIKQFNGLVAIEVVLIDPGYGAYIHITPIAAPTSEGSKDTDGSMQVRDIAEKSRAAHDALHLEQMTQIMDKLTNAIGVPQ